MLVVIGPLCDDIEECSCLLCALIYPGRGNDVNIIVGIYVEDITSCAIGGTQGGGNTTLGSIGVVGRIDIVLFNVFIVIGMITVDYIAPRDDYLSDFCCYFRIGGLASPTQILAVISRVSSGVVIIKCLQIIIRTTGYPGLGVVLVCRPTHQLRIPAPVGLPCVVYLVVLRAVICDSIHIQDVGHIRGVYGNGAAWVGGSGIGVIGGLCPSPYSSCACIKSGNRNVPGLLGITNRDNNDVVVGIQGSIHIGNVIPAMNSCSGVKIGYRRWEVINVLINLY